MDVPDPIADLTCHRTLSLLERCRGGDAAALAELTERYYPRVQRMVAVEMGAHLKAGSTPDDVVQDAFVRILKSVNRFEPRSDGSWVAFLATLVLNQLRTLAAKPNVTPPFPAGANAAHGERIPPSLSGLVAETAGVSTKVANAELVALLDREISKLDDDHREVILLRDIAECDWKTVVELMREKNPRATEGSCQQLHARALVKLAVAMRKASGDRKT